MKIVRSLALAALISSTASTTFALTCAGVEARVNTRTSQLSSAVTTLITTRQAEMVAQEVFARQRLLGAVRVLTSQMSTSNQQEVVADRSAQLALSNVVVQQSVNTQIRHAVQDYGNTGHNACGLVERGQTVADMMVSYNDARDAMAEAVREGRSAGTMAEFQSLMADWSDLVRNANTSTIGSVLDGDQDQARAFIAVVAGPPRPPIQEGTGSVASQQDRVIALQEEARNSAAALVLSDIATSRRIQVALDEMTSEWIGDDGGEAWAASMAASPTRAVLLDTARIEAQLIATTALELRRGVMEEFALATFALTYVDRLRERELSD